MTGLKSTPRRLTRRLGLEVEAIAEAYAAAHYMCSGLDLTLILGEANDGPQARTNATQNGRAWSNTVQTAKDNIGTDSRQVTIAGGYDMKVGFNDDTDSLALLNGFYSLNDLQSYDYGDAAGCPSSGRANCVSTYTWTLDNRYKAAWGLPRSFPLPQIYNTDGSQAAEWGNLTRYGAHQYSGGAGAIDFTGSLSQYASCTEQNLACTGTNNTPNTSWQQLYNQDQVESDTAWTPPDSDNLGLEGLA